MVGLAPNFAALLKTHAPKPLAPVEQVAPGGLGAGTGMTAPERMTYSPKLAALIDARRKAQGVGGAK